MPRVPPPPRYQGTPCLHLLPAGTVLYRVHRRSWAASAFNALAADVLFGGGRFDPTADDSYPYLYAAFSERTALVEVLLRSVPFDERGTRILPRATVRDRRLSNILLTTKVNLLALATSPELAAVGQDEWLVHAGPRDYLQTREWAHWLRRQAPWAQGLIWPSKRDPGERAVILFGDRCRPGDLQLGDLQPVDLDDGHRVKWLNDMLADYRVTIQPPTDQQVATGGAAS
jgi:RES domain-containing protein